MSLREGTLDMWFGLENLLVAKSDDANLIVVSPSSAGRHLVSESLNRFSKDQCLVLFLENEADPW